MDSTNDSKKILPSQGDQIPRGRHTEAIVPGSRASSSSDGLTSICDARVLVEDVLAGLTSSGKDQVGSSGFLKPGPACTKGKRRSGSDSRTSSPGGRSTGSRTKKAEEEEVYTVSSGDDGDGERTDVGCESGESFISEGGTKRKRDRTPTTGEYVGWKDAVQQYNEAKERELRLEQEKELIALTSEALFERAGLSVGRRNRVDKMEPQSDLANRVRGLQKKVLHVAKASKNLTGCFVKDLKQAALFTTACVKVLRIRMDKDPASEAHHQVEGMKRQLDEVKRERGEALRKIEELEKKNRALQEGKEAYMDKGKRRGGGKRIITHHDSSTSSEEEGNIKKKQRRKSHSRSPRKKGTTENEPMQVMESAEGEMDELSRVEDTSPSKTRVELPPKEEWPPAIRPSIKGKVKIISDQDVTGLKIHVEKEKKKSQPMEKSQPIESRNEGAVAATGLFENLVPLLNQWFESKLSSILPLARVEEMRTNMSRKEQTPKAPKAPKAPEAVKAPGTEESRKSKDQNTPALSGVQSDDPAPWSQVLSRRERARRRKRLAEQTPSTQEPAKKAAKRGMKNKVEANTITPGSMGSRGASGKVQGGKSNVGNKPTRRRPPRAAAVTLTCLPGQYAEVLGKTRREIKLEEIGVPALRPKKALTGPDSPSIRNPGTRWSRQSQTVKRQAAGGTRRDGRRKSGETSKVGGAPDQGSVGGYHRRMRSDKPLSPPGSTTWGM